MICLMVNLAANLENPFNQIQLIIYLPDCVHEPEVYKHGTQMIKKEGFALNEADVDQLITQTAFFCCCHGIKLCLPVLIRQPRCEKLFETRERLGVDSLCFRASEKD